jgi:phosphatidylserine synthase
MEIIRSIALPDLISIINVLLGFTALLMATYGDIESALILILLAAIMDGLDGIVARKIERGVLGKDLDSFSDFVSFVVAPAFIIFVMYPHNLLTCAIPSAYIVCGMLRLARYNVSVIGRFPEGNDGRFPEGNDGRFPEGKSDSPKANRHKEDFEGLPVTASGLCISSFAIVQHSLKLHYILTILLIGILSIVMISKIKYQRVTQGRILVAIAIIIILIFVMHQIGSIFYVYTATILFFLLLAYILTPLLLER